MARDSTYDIYKKNKSPELKRFRHFVEYLFLIGFQKFAGLWSIKVNQWFGKWFGTLAYHLAKKDRGIAEYQVGFCFPEYTPQQRDQLVKDTFQNMGKTLFEALAFKHVRKDPERYIGFENADIVGKVLEKGTGAVIMFAHVGNWELLGFVYEMLNIHGVAVESPIGDSKLDELLLAVRRSDNIEMIPRGDKSSARKILKCFRNNGVFLFAMDQDTKVKSVFVDFFGKKASTAKGAATFAQKFNVPVISAFGARMDDGRHKYYFRLLSEPPYRLDEQEEFELTQRYTAVLEEHIRKFPAQWVWFHRRWKTRPDHIDSTVEND